LSDGTLTSKETITIIITKDDHAPYVKDPIQDLSVDRISPDESFDLSNIFADDDPGDVLEYTILSNTNPEVVTGTINGTILILSFSNEIAGSAEITIGASAKGRTAISKFLVEVKNPTGVDPIRFDYDLRIYPNPTNGIIHLDFQRIPEPNAWMLIYDSSGRMMQRKIVREKNESFTFDNQPPGIYFIKIDQKNSKTHKIILNR
jgi:hypothetical protein